MTFSHGTPCPSRKTRGAIAWIRTQSAPLVLALLLSSCAAPTVQHPGALNSFDNTAYDTLITEQAAIEQAKLSVPVNLKPALNHVIDEYNTSMAAYKIYHQAVASGASPDIASLSAQISSLTKDVAALIKSLTK